MKKYIAKPRLANTLDQQIFDDPISALEYLNSKLAMTEDDEEKLDYRFATPTLPRAIDNRSEASIKRANKQLAEAIEDYVNIGKLIIVE